MNRVFYIVGSESTGKSTLTRQLADHYGVPGVPEFARDYLEKLDRPYDFNDLELIARGQLELIRLHERLPLVFFDTNLINIQVWFQEVFSRIPHWFTVEIQQHRQGVYLLCQPDIPWEPDPLRENPDRRNYLNDLYEQELIVSGFPYFRVSGSGDSRFRCAREIVDSVIGQD